MKKETLGTSNLNQHSPEELERMFESALTVVKAEIENIDDYYIAHNDNFSKEHRERLRAIMEKISFFARRAHTQSTGNPRAQLLTRLKVLPKEFGNPEPDSSLALAIYALSAAARAYAGIKS